MPDIQLANAERVPGNSAGAMNGSGSRKILLHSTEGSTIEGAIAEYRKHNSWPTLTVDCPRRRVVQHMPLNVAARALRNRSGGVETNRGGSVLVQIELVGFAERPTSIGDADDLTWLGRHVIRPIHDLTDVPLANTLTWRPHPASFGTGASQRLSGAAWNAYSGLLGHQHAPENDHGDPGAIDITRILTGARAKEDDMPLTEPEWARMQEKLNDSRRAAVKAVDERIDALEGRIDDIVAATVTRVLTTEGHPVRTAMRDLAHMGANDAEHDGA